MSSKAFDDELAHFRAKLDEFMKAYEAPRKPWKERMREICERLKASANNSGTFAPKELESLLMLAWTRLESLEEALHGDRTV